MKVECANPRWSFYTLPELCDAEPPEDDSVIGEGLLPRGGRMLIYAPGGMGKTTLVAHLAATMARGQPFLGRFAIERPYIVLYVQCELTQGQLRTHGQAIRAAYGDTENLIFLRTMSLQLPQEADALEDALRSLRPDILVIDSFWKTFGLESSNDQDDVARYARCLDRMIEEYHLAGLVLVHNSGKGGDARGSSIFRDWPDTTLELARGRRRKERKLTVRKLRTPGYDIEGQGFYLAFDAQGRYEVAGEAREDAARDHGGSASHTPSQHLERALHLLGESGGSMRSGDLARKLNISTRERDGVIAMLVDRGLVRTWNVRPGRKGGRPTTLIELVADRVSRAA